MSNTVHCVKLDKQAPGLPRPPLPGDLGKRIHENVCQEAWQTWLAEQTRLINEYGLHLADPKARQFLTEQIEEYFFGSGETAKTNYVPEKGQPSD